jgi:hypothetical protein
VFDEVLLVDNPYHGLDDAFAGRGLLDVSFDEYEQAKVPVHQGSKGLEDDSDNAGDDVNMDLPGIIPHGSMVVCLREWFRESGILERDNTEHKVAILVCFLFLSPVFCGQIADAFSMVIQGSGGTGKTMTVTSGVKHFV